MGLLKQDSSSLLQSLHSQLTASDFASAEKCKMYINFVTQPEQLNQVIHNSADLSPMTKLQDIFERLIKLTAVRVQDELDQLSLDMNEEELRKIETRKERLVEETIQRFISQYLQEVLNNYLRLLKEKAKRSDNDAVFEKHFSAIENAVSTGVRLLFDCHSSSFEFILNKLLKSMAAKKEDADWEGAEARFTLIQAHINRVMFEQNDFLNLTRMFTQLFGVHQKLAGSITQMICFGTLKQVEALGLYYKIWHKYGEKLGLGDMNEELDEGK